VASEQRKELSAQQKTEIALAGPQLTHALASEAGVGRPASRTPRPRPLPAVRCRRFVLASGSHVIAARQPRESRERDSNPRPPLYEGYSLAATTSAGLFVRWDVPRWRQKCRVGDTVGDPVSSRRDPRARSIEAVDPANDQHFVRLCAQRPADGRHAGDRLTYREVLSDQSCSDMCWLASPAAQARKVDVCHFGARGSRAIPFSRSASRAAIG
jgi:hypothetical protein